MNVNTIARPAVSRDPSCPVRRYPERPPAHPFVKWAGGKRALIPFLAPHVPDKIETYIEPFVGGGAVFFTFADRIGQAYLSDTNKDLITTYQIVKQDVETAYRTA